MGAMPGGGGHSGASSGSGAEAFDGGFAGSAGLLAGDFFLGIALLFGDLLLVLAGFHRGPHSSSSDDSRKIGLAAASFPLPFLPFPLSSSSSSPLGLPLPARSDPKP